MKIKNPTNTRKKLVATASVVLVVLAVLTIFTYWLQNNDNSDSVNRVDYSSPDSDQVAAGEQTAEQANPDVRNEEDEPDNDDKQHPVTQPRKHNQPAGTEAGSISITVANQDGSNLSIRSLIQNGHSDGACTLQLVRDSITVVREDAQVQMVASNHTCMGFDIDTSRLIGGDYRIDLTYRGGGESYKTTQTITLK